MSSQMYLITILIAIISPSYASSYNPKGCTYTASKFGTVYNWNNLQLRSNGQLNYYQVDDNSVDDNQDLYNYYFNLCAPVLAYPHERCNTSSDGEHYAYCNTIVDGECEKNSETQDVKTTEIKGRAYAYQLKVKDDETAEEDRICYPLSNDATDGSNIDVSLYDDLDPTQGVRIHYSKGAWGGKIGGTGGDCTTNRELTVVLKCENDPNSVPRQTEVEEIAPCKYKITVETIYGCPSGCGIYASSLCSNQGLCGYDFASNVSRCFCYWGWTGSSCERKDGAAIWTPVEAISANLDKNSPDPSSNSYAKRFTKHTLTTDPLTGELKPVDVNVTYDLTDAYNGATVYQINDTADATRDHQFYFNIAGTVNAAKLPTECQTVLRPCKASNNECRNKVANDSFFMEPNDSGYAFMFTDNSKRIDPATNASSANQCVLLGTQLNDTWTLYDNIDNPAHGVVLRYLDGSYYQGVSEDGKVVNYQFTLNLICPDSREEFFEPPTGIIMDESEVEYASDGHYIASYETAFACPYNCQTKVLAQGSKASSKAFAVCGGRGMCVADPNLKHTRCICDEKYYEDDCSKELVPATTPTPAPEQHSDTGFNVAIAIISILLIGFVVAVVYLYMRNKTLEKYAVPILDEAEQIEPRVPDYDDSDSEHFHNRPKMSGGKQEMVTVSTNLSRNNDSGRKKFSGFGLGNLGSKKKTKGRGKNKYQAQYSDGSDDDDDEDGTNGPSGYLVANEDDDESESDSQ